MDSDLKKLHQIKIDLQVNFDIIDFEVSYINAKGFFMKREEKVKQTRRKIIDFALEEFSRYGYSASSVNNMYHPEQGISKGLIYYHFASKEELFLTCVKECFDLLKDYIEEHFVKESNAMTLEQYFTMYFEVRVKFFNEYPYYKKIYMGAVLAPPESLKEEIGQCKKELQEMNVTILENLLSRMPLRTSMDYKKVAGLFMQVFNFAELQHTAENEKESKDVLDLEHLNQQILDILFYGILDRK